MELDPLKIHNPTGEAWRQCEMGRREMMIRELVQNAIEACQSKPENERDIRIYGSLIPEFPAQKLSIWNRGGMSLGALLQFADINAAIDKRNARDANFGRGAKIASIMSNKLGLRFRSCVNGRVLEVTLAADPERQLVGRIEVEDPIEGDNCIRDVTKEYPGIHDFLNTQTDWTEVVLCGNEPDQDTTRTPYLDSNLPESQWLWDAVGMRFFNVPASTQLRIHSKITRHKASGESGNPFWSRFYPMLQTMQYAHQHEVAEFDGGQIYYIQPNGLEKAAKRERRFATNFATKPFGGIVYKNEIYYLHSGTGRGHTTLTSKQWPPLALKWGLVRAYSQICILVELNDNDVLTDINRTHLVDQSGVDIDPDQFELVVRENMPEWVKELERSLEPKEDDAMKNIREHLRDLMRELRNTSEDWGLGGLEASVETVGDGQGDDIREGGKASKGVQLEESTKDLNAERRKRLMDAPEAQWVSEKWFQEHNVEGMAAYYQRGGPGRQSTIYFNEEHALFLDLISRLVKRAPEEAPTELLRDIATRHAKILCYLVVGTHVVAGLSVLKSATREEDILNGLGAIVLTTSLATARFSKHFGDASAAVRKEFRARWSDIREAV